MRRFKRLTIRAGILCMMAGNCLAQTTLELVNNQEFRVRLPWEVRNIRVARTNSHASGQGFQQDGSNVSLVANLRPRETKHFELSPETQEPHSPVPFLEVLPCPAGVRLFCQTSPGRGATSTNNLGTLSWDIVLRETPKSTTDSARPSKMSFDSEFTPLPLFFKNTASGPVFEKWEASGLKDGLRLSIMLRCFHDGFLEIAARLTNESSPRTDRIYAAVVCGWEQAPVQARSL